MILQLSPLGKKVGALHLNKLDFPSAKDDFCQVWLKLTQFFFKFVNVFSQIFNYIPLEKFTTTTMTTTTDNGHILMRKAHVSTGSGEESC